MALKALNVGFDELQCKTAFTCFEPKIPNDNYRASYRRYYHSRKANYALRQRE